MRFRLIATAIGLVLAAGSAAAQEGESDIATIYPKLIERIKDPAFAAEARADMAGADAPQPKSQARLDAFLVAHDWNALSAALDAERRKDPALVLNWERTKIFNGGGLYVVIAYVYDLWGVGNALPGERGDSLKQTALAFSLYAYALTEIDATRCSDPAGAHRRAVQLRGELAPIWSYGAGLARAERDRARMVGLYAEAVTADARRNDEVVCQGPPRGDMAEMAEGLAALAAQGKTPEEVKTPPDALGKTYVVPRAPARFTPPDVWRPAQAALRPKLPQMLAELLDEAAKTAKPG